MLWFLLNEPKLLMSGRETIRLGERPVRYLQVGAYGHSLGAAVGIGFVELDEPVTAEIVNTGNWEVDVAGERISTLAAP